MSNDFQIAINVGDVVRPESTFVLHSGTSKYKEAICVSLEPFVLVSPQADMKWETTINPSLFKVVGRAKKPVLERCMKRLK